MRRAVLSLSPFFFMTRTMSALLLLFVWSTNSSAITWTLSVFDNYYVDLCANPTFLHVYCTDYRMYTTPTVALVTFERVRSRSELNTYVYGQLRMYRSGSG